MAEASVLVLPVGVHHGDAVGQLGACEVVVEDDDVRALGGGDGAVGEACRNRRR